MILQAEKLKHLIILIIVSLFLCNFIYLHFNKICNNVFFKCCNFLNILPQGPPNLAPALIGEHTYSMFNVREWCCNPLRIKWQLSDSITCNANRQFYFHINYTSISRNRILALMRSKILKRLFEYSHSNFLKNKIDGKENFIVKIKNLTIKCHMSIIL